MVLLVDDSAGSLEASPDALTQVLGYRTDLTIFLVKVLQLVEGGDDIFLVCQFLSSFAEGGLSLQVLLEVVLTSLAVEFQQVVVLLHVELIVAPKLAGFVCRHSLDFLPFLLEGFEVII